MQKGSGPEPTPFGSNRAVLFCSRSGIDLVFAQGGTQCHKYDKHGGKRNDQVDNDILDQTGNDIVHKGHRSHSERIRKLRLHVVEVEALSAGRGQDRGIGDGGTVVATHGAGQARRNTDGEDRAGVHAEGAHHDGDQNAEGAPRRCV